MFLHSLIFNSKFLCCVLRQIPRQWNFNKYRNDRWGPRLTHISKNYLFSYRVRIYEGKFITCSDWRYRDAFQDNLNIWNISSDRKECIIWLPSKLLNTIKFLWLNNALNFVSYFGIDSWIEIANVKQFRK